MWIELLERGNSRSESYSTGRISGTTYTYPKCPGCARVLLRVHAHKARTTPDCATRLVYLRKATAYIREPAISGLEEKMRRLRRSPSNHNTTGDHKLTEVTAMGRMVRSVHCNWLYRHLHQTMVVVRLSRPRRASPALAVQY